MADVLSGVRANKIAWLRGSLGSLAGLSPVWTAIVAARSLAAALLAEGVYHDVRVFEEWFQDRIIA